jgi:UDP-N-acetylmuramoyl-tripeptide--D-alanyl-D-alanine ligase
MLLSFAETEIGIVEMGANHKKKEIEFCELAMRLTMDIQNLSKSAFEGFGGVAGVIEGCEMYRYLSLNDKFVFCKP